MTITIKARPEEAGIGAALGAGLGLACSSVISVGMPSLIPSLSAGAWGFTQSSLAAALSVAGAVAGGVLAWRQERDSHERGYRYFPDYREASKHLQVDQRAQFSGAQRRGQVAGITMGGVQWARATEVGAGAINGVIGAGKSVFMIGLADQAIGRGDRVVIHDPKGEDYVERYWKDDGTVVLLGPWDRRAAVWDAGADLPDPADADEFASAVCGADAAAGQNKSFHDNAALVLGGVIRSHMVSGKPWRWADLRNAMAQGAEALVRQAAEGDAAIRTAMASVFSGGELERGDKIALNILTTASRWLANYSAVDAMDTSRPRFSLRRWLNGTDHQNVKVVIFNNNKRYKSQAAALFGAMVTVVSDVAGSPEQPHVSADAQNGIWCIFDEAPKMGPTALMRIGEIIDLGRSRGFRMWFVFQDKTQLDGILGQEKAKPLTAFLNTRVYLHSGGETSEAVARRLGDRDVGRIITTADGGAVAGKTKTVVPQAVLRADALAGLQVRRIEGPPPHGVEFVMEYGDKLGKLLQPFFNKSNSRASKYLPSETWRRGSLPGAGPAASNGSPELPLDEGNGATASDDPGDSGTDDDFINM